MPEFIVSAVARALRDDHPGFVGCYFTVGARDLWVTHLGRLVVAANRQPHQIVLAQPTLLNEGSGMLPGRPSPLPPIPPGVQPTNAFRDTLLGSAIVQTAGVSEGAFAWGVLPQPALLRAGESYAVGSYEIVGSDWWADASPLTGGGTGLIITFSSDFSHAHGAFTADFDDDFYHVPEVNAFVPPNFFYQFEEPAPHHEGLIASLIGGTTRNDYLSWVGIYFTVGSRDILVTDLGRWILPGNSQAHDLILFEPDPAMLRYSDKGAEPQTERTVGEISPPVHMPVRGTARLETSGKPANAFAFAQLDGAPVRLQAGASYVVGSYEYAGGDLWLEGNSKDPLDPFYDPAGTHIALSDDFGDFSAAFVDISNGEITLQPTLNAYVPPSFLYEAVSPPEPDEYFISVTDLGSSQVPWFTPQFQIDPECTVLFAVAYSQTGFVNGVSIGGEPMAEIGRFQSTIGVYTMFVRANPPPGLVALYVDAGGGGLGAFAGAAQYRIPQPVDDVEYSQQTTEVPPFGMYDYPYTAHHDEVVLITGNAFSTADWIRFRGYDAMGQWVWADTGGFIPPGDYFLGDRSQNDQWRRAMLAVGLWLKREARPGIAFSHAADLGDNNNASNALRANYTLGPGSNFLVVGFKGDTFVATRDGIAAPHAGREPSATDWDDIESVTYAGRTLDFVGKTTPPGDYQPDPADRWAYFYCLSDPPPGTSELVITATNTHYLGAVAADYSGVGEITGVIGNFAPPGAASLTTAVPLARDDSLVILFEIGYSLDDSPAEPIDNTCVRRISATRFADYGLFDSDQPAAAGSYQISTARLNASPAHTTIHLALAVAPLRDGAVEPVAVSLDPAAHAPVTAAGTVAARVFPRPIGMRLDPVEHPLPEISSR